MDGDEQSIFRYYLCQGCAHCDRKDKGNKFTIRCSLPDTNWCGLQDWRGKANVARGYALEFFKKTFSD